MIKIAQLYSKTLTQQFNIKKYNDNAYRLTYFKYPLNNPGFERSSLYPEADIEINRNINPEKLDNNISRARSKIFEYAMCNHFDYFLTLTLDPEKYDRFDLPNFIKDLGQFIRNIRRNHNANIEYILIPEPHIDGAWHMHGLIKGIPIQQLIINKYNYLDWPNYSNTFGYCSIDPVRSQEAISKYMTKYIVKSLSTNLSREKEKKLYYSTRGLRVAEKVKEGYLTSPQLAQISFSYENDYIGIVNLSRSDYLELLNKITY